jgi:hypothetical protein
MEHKSGAIRPGVNIPAEFTSEDRLCVGTAVSMTVQHVFKPSTMSVVVTVAMQFNSGSAQPTGILPPLMVLKMFDRRFINPLRHRYRAGIWTPDLEQELRTFNSQDKRPHISVDPMNDSWYKDHDTDRWSVGHREAYLEEICKSLYATELETYRHLEIFQGRQLPKLYGTVRCHVLGGSVVALLLEYLGEEAFTLENIPSTIKADCIQEIGDAALQTASDIGDYGVINSDLNLGNVMVVPAQRYSLPPRVVIIDFALSRLRSVGEPDEKWRKCRRFYDTEGELGKALGRQSAGAFRYDHLDIHYREDDEPEEDF